jgi:hypothetical protein
MFVAFFAHLVSRRLAGLESYYFRWIQLPYSSPACGFALDLTRSQSDLLLENALLRQQLLTLRVQRRVKRPRFEILRTPNRAPRTNAVCERFLASGRRECLDHLLILSERQWYRVIKAWVIFFNAAQAASGHRSAHPGEGGEIFGQRE